MAKKSITRFTDKRLISFILRVGLSIAFLYAGISALLNPTSWLGFIPSWLRDTIPTTIFLPLHASFDLIVGVWLLSGKRSFYAAAIAGVELFAIILLNLGALEIVFRDISLLFSTFALMIIHKGER